MHGTQNTLFLYLVEGFLTKIVALEKEEDILIFTP